MWPDGEKRRSPNYSNSCTKKSPLQLLMNCYICQYSPKRWYTYIWVSFARKFVAKNFQKSGHTVLTQVGQRNAIHRVGIQQDFLPILKAPNPLRIYSLLICCVLLKNRNIVEAISWGRLTTSVTRKKSPNFYKTCPKMILLEKWWILTTLQKFLKNVRDLCKFSVAKSI